MVPTAAGEVAPTIDVTTDVEGDSSTDEVQRITLVDAPDGAFRLAFGGEVTLFIDIGASAGEVANALEALHAIDTVSVNKISDSEYEITFTGQQVDGDVDQLVGDVSRLSDGDPIRLFEYQRDAVGRLLSITDTDLGADPDDAADDFFASANYVYTYDQLDRRIAQNEVIAGLTPNIDLSFAYDAVSRRTSLAASIGGVDDYLNTYAYDYLDRPEWVRQQSQSGGHAVAFKRVEYRYNDIGQLTYVNRFETDTITVGTPSLRTVLDYDDANRLVQLSHKAAFHEVSVTALNEYDYVYDEASRIQSIDSMLDGLTLFSFDNTNQLVTALHDVNGESSGINPDENYQFDANGNRINDNGTTIQVDPQNRTINDGTYTYQYDSEGNRTKRTLIADSSYEVNTFDHRNRLTKVEFFTAAGVLQQAVAYTYDAFNNMVRRQVDVDGDEDFGGASDLDQIFAGFDGNQSTLEFDGSETGDLAHRRLWGPFIDQLIASENVDSLTSEGEVLWPVTDHTGTIRDIAILDASIGPDGSFQLESHRIYNSFGLLTDEFKPDIDPVTGFPIGSGTATSVDLDYGFTGKFHDDLTGLTHHQHRWFDPALGKWISEDPLGLAAGDINTTRYVNNAPLTYTDPTGLFAEGLGDGNGDSGQGGGTNGQGDQAGGPNGNGTNGNGTNGNHDGSTIGPPTGPMRETPWSRAFNNVLSERDRQDWTNLRRIQREGGTLNWRESRMLFSIENRLNATAANIERTDVTINKPGAALVPGSHPNIWDNGVLIMGGLTGTAVVPSTVTRAPRFNPNVRIGLFRYTGTLTRQFYEGQRPYQGSILVIREIMRSGTPRPDPQGVPGIVRYDVPGYRNGTYGTWEINIETNTNRIVHFFHRPGPRS